MSTLADVRASLVQPAFPGFVLLFGALYGAYGTESPFFPAFLAERNVSAEQIGLVLGAGTAIKLLAAPVAGRLADRSGAAQWVLAGFTASTGLLGLLLLATSGFWAVLAGVLAWSVAIAPLAPLADTLALQASEGGRRFPYGWVRGVGSAAFVGGTFLSGPLVDRLGLPIILWLSGALFGLTALFAVLVKPGAQPAPAGRAGGFAAVLILLRDPVYRTLLVVAGLIMGSHAMSDTFAVIRWRESGIAGWLVSLLWSDAVLAEVVVFFVLGPWLLARLGPAACVAIAASAGIVRWSVMGLTTSLPAMLLIQSLHGFTFALLHLSAMQLIGRVVPPGLAATAQTLYGAVAVGVANVAFTLASGPLYAHFGAPGFFAMAALCALSLPFTPWLRLADTGGVRVAAGSSP